MRLLGVDFGFKRIGLAIAETEPSIITPRPAIGASGTLKTDALVLSEYAKREAVDAVVVGIPLETDGVEGRMARICRTVAQNLRELGWTVHAVDESLSSVQADTGLREFGLKASQRRKLRDGEAARVILERFIDEQAHA
jgi:putative Holliday junction resolvase